MKTALFLPLFFLLVQCAPHFQPQAAGWNGSRQTWQTGWQQPQQQAWPQAPAYPSTAQPQPTPTLPPTPTLRQKTSHVQALWERSSSVRSQALAGGAELHEFTARSATESAEVCMVTFDSRQCNLRVVDQPSAYAGGGILASLMRQTGAVAGINGGFFHPDFSTLGLMISDGRKTGQFAKTSLVSGALVVIGGEPYLVWNAEFLGENGVTQMLQAGPRLVDAGRALNTLNRTKTAVRSFIANDGGRRWAIGTVRSTTLAGLGELLASKGLLPGLQVQRALNLDGGRSTAFYTRHADGRETSRPGWSTVRNYVAIVPK